MKAENLEDKEKADFIAKLGGARGLLTTMIAFLEKEEQYEQCAELKKELDKLDAGEGSDFVVAEVVKVTLEDGEDADDLFGGESGY